MNENTRKWVEIGKYVKLLESENGAVTIRSERTSKENVFLAYCTTNNNTYSSSLEETFYCPLDAVKSLYFDSFKKDITKYETIQLDMWDEDLEELYSLVDESELPFDIYVANMLDEYARKEITQ